MKIEQIVEDTLSGKSHQDAWYTICRVLDETEPDWCADRSKSPVENAVAKIIEMSNRNT